MQPPFVYCLLPCSNNMVQCSPRDKPVLAHSLVQYQQRFKKHKPCITAHSCWSHMGVATEFFLKMGLPCSRMTPGTSDSSVRYAASLMAETLNHLTKSQAPLAGHLLTLTASVFHSSTFPLPASVHHFQSHLPGRCEVSMMSGQTGSANTDL